jgi:hypothetical protein
MHVNKLEQPPNNYTIFQVIEEYDDVVNTTRCLNRGHAGVRSGAVRPDVASEADSTQLTSFLAAKQFVEK